MLSTFTAGLDALGVIAFAISGALVASRQQMDITGFALLSIVTGVGGGTLRDLLLGVAPVSWVNDSASVLLCAGVAAITFFAAHIPASRLTVVLWLDALGLAMFCVTGTSVALDAGASAIVAVSMGVITATFGGIVRDVLGNESPVILRSEIYVTAALCGSLAFVIALQFGVPRNVSLVCGFTIAFTLRAFAIRNDWSLPRYRPRGPA